MLFLIRGFLASAGVEIFKFPFSTNSIASGDFFVNATADYLNDGLKPIGKPIVTPGHFVAVRNDVNEDTNTFQLLFCSTACLTVVPDLD